MDITKEEQMQSQKTHQYMELMGIDVWHLRQRLEEAVISYLLQQDGSCITYLLLGNSCKGDAFKRMNLLNAIASACHLQLQNCDDPMQPFQSTQPYPCIVIMGEAAKDYFKHHSFNEINPGERLVIYTYHPDELLMNPAKKRLVWQELKFIAKLIKSNK